MFCSSSFAKEQQKVPHTKQIHPVTRQPCAVSSPHHQVSSDSEVTQQPFHSEATPFAPAGTCRVRRLPQRGFQPFDLLLSRALLGLFSIYSEVEACTQPCHFTPHRPIGGRRDLYSSDMKVQLQLSGALKRWWWQWGVIAIRGHREQGCHLRDG